MIETTIELKKLTAADGMVLTNGETYGTEIYLGKNDRAENWHEITRAEYDEVLKKMDSEMQDMLNIE